MRDIPMFTTEYGVASLALGQIPYWGKAYIHIRSVQEGHIDQLLNECAGFCRAAGAEEIFYTWPEAAQIPHSCVLEMRGQAFADQNLVENLFPVTDQTASQWRRIYNDRMKPVDHATYLSQADEKRLLSGGAYFIHSDDKLLGIGWLEGDTIRAIASVVPGTGERIMHTLMSLTEGDLRLEVASTNTRAIQLYESLGFVKTRELQRWYKK